ncbi:MAG TPA: hypothetical protein VNL12_12710 [Iamia sp.]|nr:hypothetical protein [Iamia sp.]HXH58156.1 hypothetical protein [Iamia sp.]
MIATRAPSQHPLGFAESLGDVGDVVQHVGREDDVDAVRPKWEALSVGLDTGCRGDVTEHAPGEVERDAHPAVVPFGEELLVAPVAASQVHHICGRLGVEAGQVEDPGEQVEGRFTPADGPEVLAGRQVLIGGVLSRRVQHDGL